MNLSVVIPVYNGAVTVGPLVEALLRLLPARYAVEIVLVNDGSPRDNSAEVCAALAEAHPEVLFIDLSRNFGEHNAVMAGLNHCTGDAAVIIDDDFQNPPEEIGKLVDKLQEGYDVVFGAYEEKAHSSLRNLGSWFNNLAATLMLSKPYRLYLCSFKAMNRFLIDEIVRYRGPYPYVDGLIWRITRRYATVPVRHDERQQGRSGYTLRKLLSLWLNMFTSFSVLPLRLAVLAGFLTAAVGFLVGAYCVIEKLQNPAVPVGWASLMAGLTLLSGMNLVALGMVGEYVGRAFMTQAGQPQFVVRRALRKGQDAPR